MNLITAMQRCQIPGCQICQIEVFLKSQDFESDSGDILMAAPPLPLSQQETSCTSFICPPIIIYLSICHHMPLIPGRLALFGRRSGVRRPGPAKPRIPGCP